MAIRSGEIKELEALYISLEGQFPDLEKELDQLVKAADKNMVMVYSRRALEVMIIDLCERELNMPRGTQPLAGIIDKLKKEKKVPDHIIVSMRNLNSLSVFGAHPKDFNPRQVKTVLLDLTTILEWYCEDFLTLDTISISEKVQSAPGDESGKKRNRILLAAAGLFAGVVVIALLIIFDVIEGFKHASAKSMNSVVILPFGNYTGADSLDYFVDGLFSSTIGEMAQISGLKVINKTTARTFKNTDMQVNDIADTLNVDVVIEGEVMCLDDSICLQIIQWVGFYKEDKSQVLNLYKKISRQIADELKVKLSATDRKILTESRFVDIEAYDAYLKGLYYLDQFTLDGLDQSRKYFELALEKDSTFGPYYAGLAAYWGGRRQFEFVQSTEVLQNIYKYLNKAVELDPNHVFTIYMTASINVWARYDWRQGEELYLKALDINENDARTRVYYAHLLSILRRPEESLKQAHLALENDPLNPLIMSMCALMEFHNGDTLVALSLAGKAIDMVPNHPVAMSVTEHYRFIQLSQQEKFEYKLDQYFFIDEVVKDSLRKTLAEKGHEAAWNGLADIFERDSPYGWSMNMAHLKLRAGEHDEAVAWLQKAFEERDAEMPYISSGERYYKPLGDNPRFISLIEKMNLPLP